MKRLALGALLLSAGAALSAPTEGPPSVEPLFGIRIRQEYLPNAYYFDPAENDRNWIRYRTRLGLRWRPAKSHVFEFRDESWLNNEVFDLLRRHNIGFCIFDMPRFTTPLEVTADFAYVRFHGSTSMYGGCYSDEELSDWAQRIAALTHNVQEAYIYFNNDIEGFAVSNALTLHKKLDELSG